MANTHSNNGHSSSPHSFDEYLASVLKTAPVRKVRANFKSVTGTFCSIDNGNIDYEAKNELESLILLESTPNVRYLIPQPDYIGHYPPDYLVVSTTRRIFTEIKYVDELIEKWDELSPNYYRAQDFARSLGAEFGFITDDIVKSMKNRMAILKGIRLLGRSKIQRGGIREALSSVLSERPSVSSKELVESVPNFDARVVTIEICKIITQREAYVMDTPTQSFEDTIITSAQKINASVDYLGYICSIEDFCSDYGIGERQEAKR